MSVFIKRLDGNEFNDICNFNIDTLTSCLNFELQLQYRFALIVDTVRTAIARKNEIQMTRYYIYTMYVSVG